MPTDDRVKYRHFFRCRTCATRFHVDRLTSDPDKVKTPKCPKKACGGKARASHVPDIGFDAAEGRAPAVGGSPSARNFDTAMQMTMQDHGMTDINDTMRPGEVSAPKLPHHLQTKADNFWGPGNKQQQQQQPAMRKGKVDLSGLYGAAATGGSSPPPPGVSKFTAGEGHAILPVLKSQPTGSSPIPKYVDITGR